MKNRLSKVLAASGVASRRKCEELIIAGKVVVNGHMVCVPQTIVDAYADCIAVSGRKIQLEERKFYYILNKPVGYVCTSQEKQGGAKRILDLFSHFPYRLFTAGRLDQLTSGLICVTNDGLFANRIIHPSYNHSREYLAKTDQEITLDHLTTISEGIWIGPSLIKPLTVKKIRRGTLKIVVAEGKKHEVRILLAAAKLTVRELIRLRIGPLSLGSLMPGEFREMTHPEILSILR